MEDTSGKIIIAYRFNAEESIIYKELKKKGYEITSIKGGQKLGDRTNQVKKFRSSKNIKIMLVQESAGAEGWDGSVAHVIVFFSPIASPKMRKQLVGRIHRKGQEHSCLVFDLVLKNSIDGRVLRNRSERFSFVQETMEYIQEHGGVERI